jgi:hypothetical protein
MPRSRFFILIAAAVMAGPPAAPAQDYAPDIGWSHGHARRSDAEVAALNGCPGECSVAVWVRDACAAIAVASNGAWWTAWHRIRSRAEKMALTNCQRRDDACVVRQWICSGRGYGAIAVSNPPAQESGSTGQQMPGNDEDAHETTGDAGSSWTHNGSVMTLSSNGDSRRFVYQQPREGMLDVGVSPGTTLFEGSRQGNRYSGTAYIFSPGCNPAPYAVSGTVSNDERTIVMRGKAPRINDGCGIKGYRNDTLVFNFVPSPGDF